MNKLGWAFLAIGVLLLVGAVFAVMNTVNLLQDGIRTTGNVVDYVVDYDNDGMLFAPVFTFLDDQGSEHRIVSNVSSSSRGYTLGEAVDVIYRRGDPEGADIVSMFGLWGMAAILGGIGVGFVFFGILGIYIIGRIPQISD